MKQLLVLGILCAALVGAAKLHAETKDYSADSYNDASVGFGVFYSSLSPYGEWIDCNLGYVWRPYHVAHGWRPYLYGRWVWTDFGWYWMSYEPFGWATFHYGRWYYDDYYGWIWMPDDAWGPAWVEWRYDDDYIGWAPLPPYATFSVGIGVTFTNRWVAPYNYWNFVPCRSFTTERVVEYVQPVERTRRIFGNTRGVVNIQVNNDRVINRGVDPGFIERRTNVHINRVEVVTRDRGEGEHLVREADRERVEVFRPRLDGRGRGELEQPRDVRRAERPIGIEGARDVHSDRGERIRERTFETQPVRPEAPRNRDTRIQDHGSREQTPSERKIDSPRPVEPEHARAQEMRESRGRDIPGGGAYQQAPKERMQEHRLPQPRVEPKNREVQKREAPKEQGKERREERGRGRRPG